MPDPGQHGHGGLVLAAFGLLAIGSGPDAAHAETSASFGVSATIAAGCSVDGQGSSGNAGTIGTLDFGHDTTLSTASRTAALSGSQTITLRCSPGVDLHMTIDGGQHSAGGNRYLQLGSSAADRLQYRLYRNSGLTDEINAGQQQSITITSANMNDVELPVYAGLSLPGGSAAGTYTDTLLVTLAW